MATADETKQPTVGQEQPDKGALLPVEPATKKPKLGWKGSMEVLGKAGTLGTAKQWSTVIERIRATTADLDGYDIALRKHSFGATFGNANADRALSKDSPCAVHCYSKTTFTPKPGAATFGRASLLQPPPTAAPTNHTYHPLKLGSSFAPRPGAATFGRAKTGRGEPPKTPCNVHSYLGEHEPPRTAGARKPSLTGTFGTAPARPASIAMTRTGLLLSAAKPATLTPLPLVKARASSQAVGFANKLKKTVSTASAAAIAVKPTSSKDGAEILVLDAAAESATARSSQLGVSGGDSPRATTPVEYELPKSVQFQQLTVGVSSTKEEVKSASPAKRRLVLEPQAMS